MLARYQSDHCRDCGNGLTWIEIAFGRFNDPVCGRCLLNRKQTTENRNDSVTPEPGNFRAKISSSGANKMVSDARNH